ncbi:Glucan endo-1,3-beta-glucosidase 12 [Acorus calamus]|uniref:Glucan endo-1,3-beta-glucosidase 12 n=1 Tax=Acorus calamus TaxID=4465 RepID=A0AAV9DDH0_ACOCL|nr:Glucan endo-1,3-beta-glucosidase 12 [Acorus calamus]
MAHQGVVFLAIVTLLCIFINMSITYADEQQWCVADPKASVDDLQKALNWACGVGGADCSPIQPNQPCFDPNTVGTMPPTPSTVIGRSWGCKFPFDP